MNNKNRIRLAAAVSAAALVGMFTFVCSTSVMARGSVVTTKETTTLSQKVEDKTEETTSKKNNKEAAEKQTEKTTKKGNNGVAGNKFTAKEPTTETTTRKKETTTEAPTEAPTDANGNPLTGDRLTAWQVVSNTFKDRWTKKVEVTPVDTTVSADSTHMVNKRTFTFDNGDVYELYRYNFHVSDFTMVQPSTQESTQISTQLSSVTESSTETTTQAQPEKVYNRVSNSFTIPGSTIEIRYIHPETGEWYMSGNPDNTAKQTLYIDTDKYHMVISVPAVYSNVYTNNTLEFLQDFEEPVKVEKLAEGYKISYSFPINADTIGEIWMLKSENPLTDWNSAASFDALSQDLALQKRFSQDGYYYPVPSNYYPYSPTMLYRHPSNYTGTSYIKKGNSNITNELGYVFVWTCMQNQNEKGYWATGPKSDWLMKDFNIGAGFYDTRFNTDFAQSLLLAYKKYNNLDFLTSACLYAEYFLHHAENNNYKTTNGGLLVQDYGYDFDHKNTHVSLNHQLAEMNFLYSLYGITKEERYLNMADKMLQAIDDTRDQWVLASNDLNYALYYISDTNVMKDYPYLTYNDLFTTKKLLKDMFNKTNDTIEYLMASKKMWMDANNVTGYYTE